MPRTALGFFIRSPLARRPFLLARKIRERAGFATAISPTASTPLRYRSEPRVAELVRSWIKNVSPEKEPPSAEDIFGTRFARADLLRWCAKGPERETGLRADIKTAWEFSRSHHMPLRAVRASPATAESLARNLAGEIHEIAETATNLNGPLWNNAMEVAIRAINWTTADDLLEGRIARAYGEREWAELILIHGRVIWARLESKLRSSNHYLADLLGLSWIARHFEGDPEAERWRRFADREFSVALRAQCFLDGGAYEASLPYHALITEMALLHLGLQNSHGNEQTGHLDRMLAIIAAARRSDGSLFAIGDDDSGRIIAVDRLSQTRGYADSLLQLGRLVLPRTPAPLSTLLLPETGWLFHRHGDWQLAANFGGVGFAGQGAHAHCDVFSFCLDWKGTPVFIDPGSYIYSGDPEARNRFRRASAHNVFAPVDRDPYPVSPRRDHLFALPGPARSYTARFDNTRLLMSGSPFGFPYARLIEWDNVGWIIRDEFHAKDSIIPTWFFQIGCEFEVEPVGDAAVKLVGPVGQMTLRAEFPCRIEIVQGEFAPHYGRRAPSLRIRAVAQATRAGNLTWRITPT